MRNHLIDREVLLKLIAYLSYSGYGEFYTSFNPLAPRFEMWLSRYNDIPLELRSIVELFLLAKPVNISVLQPMLRDLAGELCEIGLLVKTKDDQVFSPGLILLPVFGYWLLCQKPKVDPTMYFGDDSLALLTRLRPKRHGYCLDLCAGPGIQSLHCSHFADKVMAVEINPVAAQLARINSVMNEREEIIKVYCGNLYEPVKNQIFDTIIANPPLLPFPEQLSYPFVGHGGDDGMRVTWEILSGLPSALSQDGTSQILGTFLSDGILPLCIDNLKAWSKENGMNILLTITSHQPLAPGTPYFEGLVATAAHSSKGDKEFIASTYRKFLIEKGASHLSAYFLHITHGIGNLSIQDLSRDDSSGLWYI